MIGAGLGRFTNRCSRIDVGSVGSPDLFEGPIVAEGKFEETQGLLVAVLRARRDLADLRAGRAAESFYLACLDTSAE